MSTCSTALVDAFEATAACRLLPKDGWALCQALMPCRAKAPMRMKLRSCELRTGERADDITQRLLNKVLTANRVEHVMLAGDWSGISLQIPPCASKIQLLRFRGELPEALPGLVHLNFFITSGRGFEGVEDEEEEDGVDSCEQQQDAWMRHLRVIMDSAPQLRSVALDAPPHLLPFIAEALPTTVTEVIVRNYCDDQGRFTTIGVNAAWLSRLPQKLQRLTLDHSFWEGEVETPCRFQELFVDSIFAMPAANRVDDCRIVPSLLNSGLLTLELGRLCRLMSKIIGS
eukprot:TRINITY_DN3210_c0_g1_i1.p1 TRINITY_DN3210_c0_g1~~TRINITY_DN3210_c0_g1_i1.p1  ORF type:complete len:320 (-),score=40.10 TRINITY_DN3210_c0_g1_i1:809-1666(-)